MRIKAKNPVAVNMREIMKGDQEKSVQEPPVIYTGETDSLKFHSCVVAACDFPCLRINHDSVHIAHERLQ